MDPRYQWPPQGYQNGQYAPPPQPNGYPPNGYPVQYPPQVMPQQFPQSQPNPVHPQMAMPPRASQQHAPLQEQTRAQSQPQRMHPQVVIPTRNPGSSPIAQMQNPRIRQVQVPVQSVSPQLQRASSDAAQRNAAHGHARPQQTHTSVSKPVQRSQSYQENHPRPQHRTSNPPATNQNQQRAPLQPQSTPQQRTPSSQAPSSQQRSPGLPHTPSSYSRSHPQVVVKKTSHVVNSKSPHTPAKALPVDLSVLLLQAADEYIDAAHSMGSVAAMAQREADLQQYYKLMATALGCMESTLRTANQSPRDEAKLRLRYASLLIDETENDVEIEEVLSKGLALCQRSRLIDLKYSMQHLQARYQFKSNHRAALKSLDAPISEAETFQHVVWVYAFRFLKVSLALNAPGRPETASALHQLHSIIQHAEKRGDRAIYVTAHALEAMIHLRSSGPDHLENAQRAIAAARSYQLEASARHLGQIAVLIDCIDVACSLQQGPLDGQKMAALHQMADQDPGPDNGNFSVLVERSSGDNLTLSTGGIIKKAEDGRDEIVFTWLPKKYLQNLVYYLSGLTHVPQEITRGYSYLHEGFKLTSQTLQRNSSVASSIPTSIRQRNWLTTLDWHFRFSLGLISCRLDDLPHAKQSLESLRTRLDQAPFEGVEVYARLAAYLSGALDQSDGSLDSALTTYAEFELPNSGVHVDFKTDIAIIATMNRILILRDPAHPEHYLMGVLFSQLEPLCISHPNHYIEAAFRIIRVLTTFDSAINRQKTLTTNALNASQKLKNYQFNTMVLNYMTSRFFVDTVGEQAIKSARASRSMAKQNKSVLWTAVAYGLCINTFQRNGLLQDAAACQQAYQESCGRLPVALKAELQGGPIVGDVGGDFQGGSGFIVSNDDQDTYMQM